MPGNDDGKVHSLSLTGWFGQIGQSKIQLSQYPTFEPELTPPTTMTPKPWLQNHLNSLDTPNA